MKKWEYLYTVAIANSVIRVNNGNLTTAEDLVAYLNKIGSEGWELVGMTSDKPPDSYENLVKLIFKRPLE